MLVKSVDVIKILIGIIYEEHLPVDGMIESILKANIVT